MKKKIIVIMSGAMELGGIERSLLGLLDAINYELYEVDLFLYAHHGPLFKLINSNVNILPEVNELAYLRDSLKEKLRHGCYYAAYLRIRDQLLSYFCSVDNDNTWAKVMRHSAHKLTKKYDMAISFFLPFDFAVEMVDAKIKIGWVHTDYLSEEINKHTLYEQYSKVDLIAAVSEQCKQSFGTVFPDLLDKVIVIENILSKEFITQQAGAFDVCSEMKADGTIRLLSIGRYCTPKNFDNIPDICSKIIDSGINIKWYIIGFGPDEELIRQKIIAAGMEEHVIMLGKKENPYPYIAACDLYVQPSRYEGKAVTVREAQILGKPVVITRYATSESQLENGLDGIIVPIDNQKCADGISSLLRNPEKMRYLSDNCKNKDFSNRKAIEIIYGLMDRL